MKVKDVMNRAIDTCAPETDLAAAAMIMWRDDCGVVPVTDEEHRVVGVITDRDICMAVATRHLPPEHIRVQDVMSDEVHTVRAEDELGSVLDKMRRQKVRRIPVADKNGMFVGLVSLNDLVLHAEPNPTRASGAPTAEQLLSVMKSVCEHRNNGKAAGVVA